LRDKVSTNSGMGRLAKVARTKILTPQKLLFREYPATGKGQESF